MEKLQTTKFDNESSIEWVDNGEPQMKSQMMPVLVLGALIKKEESGVTTVKQSIGYTCFENEAEAKGLFFGKVVEDNKEFSVQDIIIMKLPCQTKP
jgi:hypothetical protein